MVQIDPHWVLIQTRSTRVFHKMSLESSTLLDTLQPSSTQSLDGYQQACVVSSGSPSGCLHFSLLTIFCDEVCGLSNISCNHRSKISAADVEPLPPERIKRLAAHKLGNPALMPIIGWVLNGGHTRVHR